MRASVAVSALFTLAASVNAWSATLYDTSSGSDPSNYYLLEGDATSESSAGCITLPGTIPGDVTSCKYFTDGGFSSKDCSEGGFTAPTSWILEDGQCAIYHGTECAGSVSSDSSHSRSDVYNPSSNFNSMKCWNA